MPVYKVAVASAASLSLSPLHPEVFSPPGASTLLSNLVPLVRSFQDHLWGLFHSGQLLARIFIYLGKVVLPIV